MHTSGDECDEEVFDAIVIGTGFAGAVTAARLVEAGQRVCVLERGRKYEGHDFPMYPDAEALLDIDGGTKPSGAAPDLARWLWSIDQGIYDVRDLDDVVSVQAAGYGGGSLIYANVHLRAPDEVFQEGWPAEYQRTSLDPYYDRVAYMLDVKPLPPGQALRKTEQLKGLAKQLKTVDGDLNLVHAISPPLAVTFATGEHAPGLSKDERDKAKAKREEERPWTKGERQQKPCDMRGHCWLGCRKGAKNSLDFNYLRIVEKGIDERGEPLAHIHLGAEVQRIEADDEVGGGADRYTVYYRDHLTAANNGTPSTSDQLQSCRAKYVFLAAGAVNTTELLMRSKQSLKRSTSYDHGEDRWPELGSRYFPNADSLAAVFDCKEPQDGDHGPTITSALLHQKPRRTVEAESKREKDQERYLWAIDFRPTLMVAEETVSGLLPGAVVHIAKSIDPEPGLFDEITHLVEPPIFDVGGFEERSGVAMLVLDGSDNLGELSGKILSVRLDDGALYPFGTIIGKARKLEDWFLIEDGGYPSDIEPFLGILRSPLWLRRNRFIEPLDDDQESAERRKYLAQEAGPLPFPLATAMEAFFGVPRRSTRVSTGLDDISKDDVLLAASPLEMSLDKMLPEWFQEALADDRADLAKAVAPIVGQMLEAVLDDVAEQLVNRFDAMALAGNFSDDVVATLGTVPEKQRGDLVRGMLRQAIQLLWGSEVALAKRVNQLLIDKIPKDAYSLARALAPLAGWLLNYKEGNGRTALLLTMGRDQYRGRLTIDEKSDRLTANLPKPLAPSSRVAQEQVLRSIASTWQGELRTNPAWSALNRRITVHSQGGCPMCTCRSDEQDSALSDGTCVCMAVTKPNGEVVGCEGLYVMDAAAFPTAVGVNPSATIAAVAEYKIETFIENVLVHDQASSKPDDRMAVWDERRQQREVHIEKWIDALKDEYGNEHVLDPLAPFDTKETGKPASQSLGLTFEESMSGLFVEPSAEPSKERDESHQTESVIDWDNLTGFESGKSDFDLAERQGMEQNNLLTLKLKATIEDLDRFFRTQRQGLATKIGLSGHIHLNDDVAHEVDASKSYLKMFYRPPSSVDVTDNGSKAKRRCFFRYHIVSKDPKKRFWIDAAKVLGDDVRFDVWQDLATLYFEWFEGEQSDPKPKEVHRRGIVRLAPFEFFQKQLQTISITPGGADPARKSWAYVGFINFFADEVASIYLERRGQIKAMVKNLLNARGG